MSVLCLVRCQSLICRFFVWYLDAQNIAEFELALGVLVSPLISGVDLHLLNSLGRTLPTSLPHYCLEFRMYFRCVKPGENTSCKGVLEDARLPKRAPPREKQIFLSNCVQGNCGEHCQWKWQVVPQNSPAIFLETHKNNCEIKNNNLREKETEKNRKGREKGRSERYTIERQRDSGWKLEEEGV